MKGPVAPKGSPIRMSDPMREEAGWQLAAACRGEDAAAFYAPNYFEKRSEKDARETVAKRICAVCPVREACLEYALATREPHGVWGGCNEMERRALLRQRAQVG